MKPSERIQEIRVELLHKFYNDCKQPVTPELQLAAATSCDIEAITRYLDEQHEVKLRGTKVT